MSTQITNCQFCGKSHGVRCPEVKAIEYHESGVIRRVEFMTARDYMAPLSTLPPLPNSPATPQPWWPGPTVWGPSRTLAPLDSACATDIPVSQGQGWSHIWNGGGKNAGH